MTFALRIYTILGLIAAIVCAVILLFSGCSKKAETTEPEPMIEELEPGAFGKITDFVFTRTRQGRTEFELKAESAVYFEDGAKARFEKAGIVFYAEDQSRVEMTANGGTVRTDTQDIEASGDVRIVSSHGWKARTDHLNYDAKSKTIKTDAKVSVEGEKLFLNGTGMELSPDAQTLEIGGPVKALLAR